MARFRRMLIGLVVVVVVAGGCGGDDSDDESSVDDGSEATDSAASSGDLVTSEGCGTQPAIGAGERQVVSITVDGQERSYLLYVGSGLAAEEAAPLVLIHHGLSGTAEDGPPFTRFDETADSEGLIVAYPDAGDGEWNLADQTDTGFVAAVIDDVGAAVCVDVSRVYAVGFSQGGHMAGLLGCVLRDRVAAAGAVAAWTSPGFDSPCPEADPTPMIFIVGNNDSFASPDDGYLCVGAPGCSVGPIAEEASAWASTNGCEAEPTETAPDSGVVRWEYSCPADAELVVYVHDGGHEWPHDPFNTNVALWEFLDTHSI